MPADVREMSYQRLQEEKRKLKEPGYGSAVDLSVVLGEIERRKDLKMKDDESKNAGLGFPDSIWLVWDHLKWQMLPIPDEARAETFSKAGYAVERYERSQND